MPKTTTQAGIALDVRVQQLLDVLHQGGQYRFLQNLNAGPDGAKKKKAISVWYKVGEPVKIPKAWDNDRSNIFFGVSPSSVLREAWQASRKDDICALNCLYAEFDGKDFTNPNADEIEQAYQELLRASTRTLSVSIDKALRNEAIGQAGATKYATNPAHYRALAKDHVDNLNPAPSVIIDSGGGYQCVPLDTEILTKDGWKTWESVLPGETVLGYNRDTEAMEWTTMTTKIVKDTDDLVKVSNGIFSAVCTPGHRWVTHVKTGHGGKTTLRNQLTESRDLSSRRHKIILSAPYKNTLAPSSITQKEAAILGWIATDGSIQIKNGIAQTVKISQSDKMFPEKIKALLADVPHIERREHGDSDMTTWRINTAWFRKLWSRTGLTGTKHTSDWCSFVLALSDEAREAFLEAAFDGDGHYEYGKRLLTQNPGNISEALKLAIFLTGKTPLTSRAEASGRKCEVIRPGKPSASWHLTVEESSSASVWCPQTELGTWVMRQGDTICITGNCYWLLDDTLSLPDAQTREQVQAIQKRWVYFVGADRGVHDLRRILRVPGTYNHKKKYAPNFPLVEFITFDLTLRYAWQDLVDLLPPPPPEPEPLPRVEYKDSDGKGSVIDRFNDNNDIRDVLLGCGCTDAGGSRMSRPGSPDSGDVIIFREKNACYSHSTNNPLHDGKHAHSPFGVYCIFEHNGDAKTAVAALKKEWGEWVEVGERARIIDPLTGEIFSTTKTRPATHVNGTNGTKPVVEHGPRKKIVAEELDEDGEELDEELGDESAKVTDNFDGADDDPFTGETFASIEDGAFVANDYDDPDAQVKSKEVKEKLTIANLNPLDYRAEDGGVMDAWMDLYGEDWKYIVGPDKWRAWGETHWKIDENLSLPRQIIELLDVINLKCETEINQNKKLMRRLEALKQGAEADETAKIQIKKLKAQNEVWTNMQRSTKRTGARVSSIETLCQKVRAISVTALDKDDSLNVRNGVYSLAGLELRPHSREELFTYCLGYDYNPADKCPRFLKFLREVLVCEKQQDGQWITDENLVSLFQELLGYSLTTHVKREVMIWMFGDGGNGKSVVIAIIEALLGGLAGSIDFQSLGTPGNYELSDIPGKRVIFATEADRGGTMAEKYIKQIVSGDTLKGRPIYGTQIEFKSTAKIWWSMNDRPIIRDTSDSIWRRMKMIPFYRKFDELGDAPQELDEEGNPIKKSTADVDLIPKLLDELPGILNWAIDGLVRLKRNNKFTYSEAAETAKKQYREESNPVQRWVNTMCVRTNVPATLQAHLFEKFSQWSREQNEKPITSTQFGKDLGRLKIAKYRKEQGVMYHLALVIHRPNDEKGEAESRRS